MLFLVPLGSLIAIFFAIFLIWKILRHDEGTPRMKEIADKMTGMRDDERGGVHDVDRPSHVRAQAVPALRPRRADLNECGIDGVIAVRPVEVREVGVSTGEHPAVSGFDQGTHVGRRL